MVYLPHFPLPNRLSLCGNSPKRMSQILQKLNNPHHNLGPLIHIAGTNGKGSTAAILAKIFTIAGYKTHIYTSPHIHNCNERIKIYGNDIDDNYLYQLLEEIRIISESENIYLTLFEGLTLAAILAFNRNKADISIIETGMGGRIDATNVIDNKIVTILTSISLDHEEFLGNNLAAIAAEKSYIMRPKVPAIIAPAQEIVKKMIMIRSEEINSPLINFDINFKIAINDDQGFDFVYERDDFKIEYQNLNKPNLEGWHQYINSSLAIAAISSIADFYKDSSKINFTISKSDINQALSEVKWISRLEKVTFLNKFIEIKDSGIYIDGAHNIGGAQILSDWIKEKIVEDYENNNPKRNYLITGFSKNKAKPEFFTFFKDIIDYICAIRVNGEPNPEEAKIIVENSYKSGFKEIIAKDDLFDAIYFLKNLDKKHPCRIIICGSLYLARDLKKLKNLL